MTSPQSQTFRRLAEQIYQDGFVCFGDLGIDAAQLEQYLLGMAAGRSISGSHQDNHSNCCFDGVHSVDLYLAAACALGRDLAWKAFISRYRGYLNSLVKQLFLSPRIQETFAEDLISHLFMPDGSGRRRIGSYDGRCPLRTWLAVIVSRRAINERKRAANVIERPLECAGSLADGSSAKKIEAAVKFNRYHAILADSCKTAVQKLDERDRLIVALLYKDGLSAKEVAAYLGVARSTFSYHMRRIHKTLRREITAVLIGKHGLCHAAVEECLDEALENPNHSLLRFLT